MKPGPPTLREQLSYRLDNLLARQPLAKVFALFALVIVMIIVGGVAWELLVHKPLDGDDGQPSGGFLDGMWAAWTFVSDPGTQVAESQRIARVVAVFISIGGVLFFAMLVGLITDGIGERMDELRRGRSRVLEEGHTLILGWSDRVVPLIQQIAIANESEGGGVVVLLADQPKDEMERIIAETAGDLRGTSVVCRTGSPAVVGDLEKAAASAARSTVVLAAGNDHDADASDSEAIRTVLALRKGVGELRGHIVVELRDVDNAEVIDLVGGPDVEVIVGHDITGRLMIQCARQPGLAQVYASLLGFDGDEFYLRAWPEMVGKTFGEVRRSFADAIVCGVKPAKRPEGRRVVLVNPAEDRIFEAGDELLVVAEDDDTYFPMAAVDSPLAAVPEWTRPALEPERLLFCGWRRDLDDMITELDQYVAAGSELTILAQVPRELRGSLLMEGGLTRLKNLKLVHEVGNPELRRDLERVGVERYDSVLVLADESWEGPPNQADSRALVSLILIRDIQRKKRGDGERAPTLISEICDPRTKRLVTIARVSDYVVSNEIISMAMSQVAERREVAGIWGELFEAADNEIYLKDRRHYLEDGAELSFWELSGRARKRGEILLGWKRATDEEPVLNPRDKAVKVRFGDGDAIVVIARDEA